ncbi:ATP-binding cassette domain-containing protein [Clostridium septicum]|uniref:ATP-binding cassette domain-containing protein n=1 Tax=Clostridium septicum TaxID=1504 RepID=A0ABY5B381_CLOSE|nr:ATP-binding cassette domain-containing protein [Clostridium septicum]MDU1315392.1 ATP-binding cassette domain-containing protein [Clostridium septicum]QAS59733.1 ABC transporter ATP-binding protein [Clostridium septicum]UEC21025.1 ATP-binding cassette domain-containing protein [Clostridium septicum]USS00926.1 ATP-binding cassette domain-containing protein [Clostridium septicum]
MYIKNINVNYGNKIIYKDFSINIESDKINCIIGQSGCGKTTLLKNISKELIKNGVEVSFVFQEDRLIPWKTVYENLYLISKSYYSKDKARGKVLEVLIKIGLEESKKLYPNELSGGMKQKINIARALISKSKFLIMDEPFKSIDIKSKIKIINIIKEKIRKEKLTVIFVSHDKEEIDLLGEKIFILDGQPIKIIEEYDNFI